MSETRPQALARLQTEYQRASAETYQPVFAQRLAPEQRALLEQRLAPYHDDPVFQDAMRRAEQVFSRDRRNGLVTGQIDDNFARWAHYVKLGMDDAAKLSGNPMHGGVGPTELRGIREMRARIIGAIDEAVPGYRDARARWGGLVNAEEALDEGAAFLTATPETVSERLAQMTEFERLHARIGLVDEITRGMRGGQVVGQRNVANALDYRDTQDIIAAAFDNPQQAADFLDTLNNANQLMRNAQTWNGGSSTAANAAHGADEALNTAADMAGDVLQGRAGNAIGRGVRSTINAATLGAVERANNVRGEALLTRVDTPDSAEFARMVVEELRRRQALRRTNAQAARYGAAAAGAQQGRRRP